ncbi:MAG: TMEM175 family protein [Gemmatimonadales bacterium]
MVETHPNARLEAFSDGVFAIAMTLLIIDIQLPSSASIGSSAELWRALRHLMPAIFAFVMSFVILLIAWVNHRGALRLMSRSAPSFMYANGLLLLTIVFMPFPTALLGSFVLTDRAAPAVVLYDALLGVQAFTWLLLGTAAINNNLAIDLEAIATIRANRRNACYGIGLYGLLALAALWIPLVAAIVTAASWVYWLMLGVRMKTPD